MRTLTLAQARRVAVAAQGLDRARPAPVTTAHVRRTVERTGLLQIDSVNVLARAHLLPLFSRLGPYDVALLERATARPPRRLVETWGHEACYVPAKTYPLLLQTRRRWSGMGVETLESQHPGALAEVRAVVAESGPVTTREVERLLDARYAVRRGGWGWRWSVAKLALENLFDTGEITAAHRTAQFERAYDLTERVLPPAVLARGVPDPADASRELVRIAARAHGVASLRCLADYFRRPQATVRAAVADLVDAGELEPVRVHGWGRPAWLHVGARVPRRTRARALLAPFDPLVFERERLATLFGMHYRIGIYTPAAQRTHGYYVLPFLLGEHLVARVDLKADRPLGVLRVRTAYAEEPGAPGDAAALATWPGPGEVVTELAAELAVMAQWLGLGAVVVDPDAAGDLTGPLRAVVGG
ncbi:winged helix-turn-helix domain-containing protein [Georgenia wangjunii]|uniref:winged helix-turn-helix domain-containing protein n=1 Tax=Georgenia wangjunii TaxID=3117730 RepID=UPI002F267263